MNYKYVLFDLDGTLTNPKEGITKSVVYSLEKQNIKAASADSYEHFIGPPLDDSYREMGFGDEQIAESIRLYRERFEAYGWIENVPYEGIHDLLEKLNETRILGVATSKPTYFAEKILNHFELSKYFKVIVGSNMDRTRVNKNEVIEEALRQLGNPSVAEVLMIGDRIHDLEGAKKHGMDALRVLYGFGDETEHEGYDTVGVADSVQSLKTILTTSI